MTIRKGTYTFEKWCIDNNKSKYLDLWDYELNRKNPSEVSHKTKDKYYFKCECGKHVSFQKGINNLINSKDLICVECNSFYEWCISNGKNDILDCWDYKINLDDPKFVSFGSGKKYWFKINEDCSYLFNISYITSRTKALSPIEKYYNSLGFYLIKKLWRRCNIKILVK